MKIYRLEKTQLVEKTVSEVFAFFERPENLAKITPPALGFKILTPEPLIMQTGTVIDYTIRPLGFSWHWRTLIVDYNPPIRFVDIQLKGPYKFWHHTHTFLKIDKGTLICDRVCYALPFGFSGQLAHVLFVKKQLENIFEYRRRVIDGLFAGNKTAGDVP